MSADYTEFYKMYRIVGEYRPYLHCDLQQISLDHFDSAFGLNALDFFCTGFSGHIGWKLSGLFTTDYSWTIPCSEVVLPPSHICLAVMTGLEGSFGHFRPRNLTQLHTQPRTWNSWIKFRQWPSTCLALDTKRLYFCFPLDNLCICSLDSA